MADPVIMAANERVKSISRTLLQIGSALLAAATIRIYTDNWVSLEAGGWILTAAALMWLGWKILIRLEPES
jgi:hypothetical protein